MTWKRNLGCRKRWCLNNRREWNKKGEKFVSLSRAGKREGAPPFGPAAKLGRWLPQNKKYKNRILQVLKEWDNHSPDPYVFVYTTSKTYLHFTIQFFGFFFLFFFTILNIGYSCFIVLYFGPSLCWALKHCATSSSSRVVYGPTLTYRNTKRENEIQIVKHPPLIPL